MLLVRDVKRLRPLVGLITCLGVLLAYLTAAYITGPFHEASKWMGAMLSATSVIVVLKVSGYRESLRAGWMRVLGTFLGALIAFIYLINWTFSIEGLVISVFVLESINMMLGIYHSERISTITLVVILFISQDSPHLHPAMNCLLRFVESAVGVGIGIGLVWVLDRLTRWRERPKKQKDATTG